MNAQLGTALTRILAPAALAMVVIAAAACGSQPTATPLPTATQAPTPTPADTDLTGILATTDLNVGSNRVSFLLLSPRALINVPQVSVRSTLIADEGSDAAPAETATASFYIWPYGTRGNYVTQLSFDRRRASGSCWWRRRAPTARSARPGYPCTSGTTA